MPIASANAPLPTLRDSVRTYYLEQGVPPGKIILGLPLYGYAFPCATAKAAAAQVAAAGAASGNPAGHAAGNAVGDAAGAVARGAVLMPRAPPACAVASGGTDPSTWQAGLGTIQTRIARNETRARGVDTASASPYLEYDETKTKPLGRRQVSASRVATQCSTLPSTKPRARATLREWCQGGA